ncbi:MAG: HEAT repeat domain-containing protein [Planctomycetes bacterium]|nr:HEAT repeat domain-containing protein [Planctomycetota bacterium]
MSVSYYVRTCSVLVALLLVCAHSSPARAQDTGNEMVGQSTTAWSAWQSAMNAIDRDEKADAAKHLEAVAAMKLSDLRLALMADRSGSIRLEEMSRSADAPAVAKDLVAKIGNGRKQKALAEDGWHFAAIGRFTYADANFKALDESSPDPVALLELSRQNPNRHTILIKLMANAEVGPSAKRFLELLNRGEEMLRMDANEIAANIEKLAGPERMNYNATNRLKSSGEFAVPQMLAALADPKQKKVHAAILQVLPQIGRDAINPLCIALSMNDNVIRQVAASSLAKIGYKTAAAYLAKLADDSEATAEARAAANQALGTLGVASGSDKAALFYDLAEAFYNNTESLKADVRRDTANVWYLRDNELRVVEVPTAIFNDVMAMRCCEEALRFSPDKTEATALWIAANFRREAKLGLDVESDRPDPLTDKDGTRPENYPRAIYFARAAGPQYNHMVLARAFKDRDPGVALGAIASLTETAGEPSLVGNEDIKQPLVQTLAFPNKQVRIKAALALGRALPKTGFSGADNVVPVLAEALMASGHSSALVVDPDDESANKFQAVLRSGGFECARGANVHQARNNGQKANLTSFDVILIATDVAKPDLLQAVNDLRRDPATAATPIIVIVKAGEMARATNAARLVGGVDVLPVEITDMGDPEKIKQQMMNRVERAAKALGMLPLSSDLSLSLAMQSADVLRAIAESRSKVFDASRAVGSLITALSSKSEALRVKAASALALIGNADGQAAIAKAAMNTEHGAAERLAAFASLAESARRNGNMLGTGELVTQLIEFTMNEKDLVLRAAGSRALGALNLASNKASEIIRAQYRG